jgi:predicted RNA binding protein YcfA (HicA-like mRNA interferase family)
MPITSKEAIRLLKKGGFKEVRQNGTSHKIFKKGQILVPVPIHPGDLSPKVEHNIKKAAGLK